MHSHLSTSVSLSLHGSRKNICNSLMDAASKGGDCSLPPTASGIHGDALDSTSRLKRRRTSVRHVPLAAALAVTFAAALVAMRGGVLRNRCRTDASAASCGAEQTQTRLDLLAELYEALLSPIFDWLAPRPPALRSLEPTPGASQRSYGRTLSASRSPRQP